MDDTVQPSTGSGCELHRCAHVGLVGDVAPHVGESRARVQRRTHVGRQGLNGPASDQVHPRRALLDQHLRHSQSQTAGAADHQVGPPGGEGLRCGADRRHHRPDVLLAHHRTRADGILVARGRRRQPRHDLGDAGDTLRARQIGGARVHGGDSQPGKLSGHHMRQAEQPTCEGIPRRLDIQLLHVVGHDHHPRSPAPPRHRHERLTEPSHEQDRPTLVRHGILGIVSGVAMSGQARQDVDRVARPHPGHEPVEVGVLGEVWPVQHEARRRTRAVMLLRQRVTEPEVLLHREDEGSSHRLGGGPVAHGPVGEEARHQQPRRRRARRTAALPVRHRVAGVLLRTSVTTGHPRDRYRQ